MIYDTSQRSIAMSFKCGGTFDDYLFYKFTAESVLKEFLNSLTYGKIMVEIDCLKRPLRVAGAQSC